MGLLPDIIEGRIQEAPERKLYTPPSFSRRDANRDEERMSELNNLGRKVVTEDFSDSPHLKKI